jgi:hypothetical protein
MHELEVSSISENNNFEGGNIRLIAPRQHIGGRDERSRSGNFFVRLSSLRVACAGSCLALAIALQLEQGDGRTVIVATEKIEIPNCRDSFRVFKAWDAGTLSQKSSVLRPNGAKFSGEQDASH